MTAGRISECSIFHTVAMMMVTPQAEPRPNPSRNPLPLSAAQEAQVRDLYYKRVRAYCADEIRGTCTLTASHQVSLYDTDAQAIRLRYMRHEPYDICNVGLPNRTSRNEFMYDILCDSEGTGRSKGGVVLYCRRKNTSKGRKGEEKEGAGKVP